MQDGPPTLGRFIRAVPEQELKKLLSDIAAQRALAVFTGDCSKLNPGDICKVYPCVNHVQLVLKCDRTKGCTNGEEYAC